ncbi:MAG: hypothetical protein GY758_12515 [Fuerstiella sp.]|nr:hypothetical protein [Fuerstiella sp.]
MASHNRAEGMGNNYHPALSGEIVSQLALYGLTPKSKRRLAACDAV